MRIEFDTGNPTELQAVQALIMVLRGGDVSLPILGDQGDRISGSDERLEVEVDPREAFDGVDAETAFGGGAAAPLASGPTAAETGTSHTSGPAGTQDNGDNGSASGQAAPTGASPSNAPADVDVDKGGLPYDKRIHSNPPTKKKDGYWRQKRGVDAALVTQVEAELRQAMAAPAAGGQPAPMFEESAPGIPLPPAGAPAAPSPAPAATGNGTNAVADTVPAAGAAAPATPSVPAPPAAAPVAPAVPLPPAAGADTQAGSAAPSPAAPSSAPVATFADLMRKITGMQTAGTLTVAQTQEIASSLGLSGVRDLMHRSDLIPSFDALLPAA